MFNPIQPNNQTTILPFDTFPGQKVEKAQDIPRPVVERKQETPSAREEVPREEVEKAADKLNRLMGIIDKRLEFRVREKSKRIVVKIVDQDTEDVLDEIPPIRLMDILSSFSQIAGLLIDKSV